MKEYNVTIGQWYVVEGAAGDTITNPSTGRVIATVEDGKQATFYASTSKVVASSDSVQVLRVTFNSAPAKLMALGLLGGGAQTLPAGYIAAEFLESTGTQYIKTDILANGDLRVLCNYEITTNGCVYGSREGIGTWGPVNASYVHFSSSQGITFGYNSLYPYLGAFDTNKKSFFKATNSLEIDGKVVTEKDKDTFTGIPLFVFSCNTQGEQTLPFKGKIYNLTIEDKTHKAIFVSALDNQGAPCLYDTVAKQPFYNSGTGSFIVGFTLAQARKLSKLPATGGSLTISLPSNWQEDEGVVNALATAEANGWVLTYQTYEADASTASTFALRRIFVRKTQDENGQYVDADGSRWHVEWCAGMIGAAPTDHGYEPFRSVDAAVAYWELPPWVDPEQEELLTNSTTNEHE